MKGYIHSFESLAAVDGEGVRCAVFLAGCPLRCAYCHNPDTWSVDAGKEMDAETLVKKVARFKPYFGQDGGVTFSGGEPLVQVEFIKETAELLEPLGINYVIDTSGVVELTETVKTVLDNARLVILDLKFWDDESYIKYTGHGIDNTLKTLRYLDEIGKRTWVRTVVVPGINDNEETLSRYLEVVKGVNCIERYELLAFHTMGFYKYTELGVENRFKDIPPLDIQTKDKLQEFVNKKLK